VRGAGGFEAPPRPSRTGPRRSGGGGVSARSGPMPWRATLPHPRPSPRSGCARPRSAPGRAPPVGRRGVARSSNRSLGPEEPVRGPSPEPAAPLRGGRPFVPPARVVGRNDRAGVGRSDPPAADDGAPAARLVRPPLGRPSSTRGGRARPRSGEGSLGRRPEPARWPEVGRPVPPSGLRRAGRPLPLDGREGRSAPLTRGDGRVGRWSPSALRP